MQGSHEHPGRDGRPDVLAVQIVVLALLLAAIALVSNATDWSDPELIVPLAVLAIGSHLFPLAARGVHISGAFLGLALAMAIIGPAPAAAMGVTAVLLDALRSRPPLWHLMTDLVTYAAFPLFGGLLVDFAAGPAGPRGSVSFAILVGGVFLAANLLNFALIVGQTRLHRGSGPGLRAAFNASYVPVLPWQLAAAFVTAIIAFGHEKLGVGAVALLALVLFVFLLLLRAVLQSEQRGDELRRQVGELEHMHAGLMAVMLDTLSLRDPMTARHSAAVARYSRAVAVAAGLSPHEQGLVHMAGLVHDIGKSAFSDELLTKSGPLSDEEFAMIRRHPEEGARILRRVRGYEEIAEIVHAHHERIDGRGYPRGLTGDEIPTLSRIISVSDVYDVITARDTYRRPVSHDEAVAELRRVAGTQLDSRFVELFIAVMATGVAFAHADDTDLEAELRKQRGAWPQALGSPLAPN